MRQEVKSDYIFISIMNVEDIAICLGSKTRRKILQFLCEMNMSAIELHNKMGKDGPKYRQSVNKQLEILKKHGLLDKYYDDEKSAICYRILSKSISIDINEMLVKLK